MSSDDVGSGKAGSDGVSGGSKSSRDPTSRGGEGGKTFADVAIGGARIEARHLGV